MAVSVHDATLDVVHHVRGRNYNGTTPETAPSASPAAAVQLSECRPAQLSFAVNQYAAGGFGVLASNSGAQCRLVGRPEVQGFDTAGRRIAVAHQSAHGGAFAVRHGATAIAWMTIDVNHTSCRVEIARLVVRLTPASRPVTVRGRWWARPSAEHPYGCAEGPAVSPRQPYSVGTTGWRAAPSAG